MERRWLKISETAEAVGVTPKELRYWESVLPEIKPRRSKGNLRYYHVDELPRLRWIRGWLREGLTVADCQELLAQGVVGAGEPVAVLVQAPPALETPKVDTAPIVAALQALLARLDAQPPQPKPQAKPKAPKPQPPPPGTPPLLLED